ncbi:MAG TPA: M15 family metallopeptidase [Thermoanaerobaculia bacterium]|nr:M15 family metallopeptidase [Thermoanaerobaculia bacterium]
MKKTLLSFALVASAIALACAGSAAPPAATLDRPPIEAGQFRAPDLVELVRLDPTIHLDIRYATSNNFARQAVYKEARAFLQRPAAEAVVRAHHALAAQGYGIVVFDGYRPWSVTKHFWEIVTPEDRRRGFVANPAKGSKHNRGCAVDLSLYVLATGAEAEMPSTYDEFSDRASPKYKGGPPELLARRDLLRATMEREGFEVDPGEWWHYNYRDWRSYPILDVPFEDIGKR